MLARRGLLCALGGGIAALLGGCGLFGSPEVRYRVIVEIDDRGTIRSGSSVWSWTLSEPTVPLASSYSGKFAGEAVAIGLDGRTLFAILRGGNSNEGAAQMIPERLFGDVGRSTRGEQTQFNGDRIRDLRDIASRTGEQREIDCRTHPDWCPMLVTFREAENAASIEQVDPLALDKTFGQGVRLRRVLVELTEDPVTRGLEKRLEWLPSQSGALMKRPKNVAIGDMPLAGRLHDGDFSQ